MTRTAELAAEFNQRRNPAERDIPVLAPKPKRVRPSQASDVRKYATLTDEDVEQIIALRREYLREAAMLRLRQRALRDAHRKWGGPKALANKFNVPAAEIAKIIAQVEKGT